MESDKIVLLFFSDGTANYPSNAIKTIKADVALFDKIRFQAVGFSKYNAVTTGSRPENSFFWRPQITTVEFPILERMAIDLSG